MPFTVTREPPDIGPHERCCFCRNPTPFWYTPKDVACCPSCAKTHKAADVPTKAEWFRRETVRMDDGKCTRSACRVELGEHYGIHTSTHARYCLGCMRAINRACMQQIVVFPEDLPKDPA